MNIRRLHIFLLLMTMLILILSACSTKKNKWNRRVYHNLTGHYNAYFNGQEALKKAANDIANAHVDDYTQILSVFPLGTGQSVSASAADLDRAILKASLVVHKHSMYFAKKEQVKWVYYSYLLMAKAKFYKQEYESAKQIFRFITTKYPEEDVKQDALLWIALIESLQGNYAEASSLLDAVRSKIGSGKVSAEAYRMLPMVYADIYLRQQNYQAAIPQLENAILRNKKKTVKARLYFILASIEQKQGNLKTAKQRYNQVLKTNPSYQMDFNARINMADCFEGGDSHELVKQLSKMLKDSKNKEFQDQIYYVLAGVALKEKDKPKAINYLELSVETSTNNHKQKAFSALKLADLFFEEEKYLQSQSYYDSTMLFLPKDYFDYERLDKRNKILNQLVKNLIVIQTEDSLQALAAMSESARSKQIDKFIQAEYELEKQKAKQEQERLETLQFLQENRQAETKMGSVTETTKSSFYFYNSTSVTAGQSEFIAKWGNRKLSDLWRLSDKEVLFFDPNEAKTENEDDSSQASTTPAPSTNKKSREYYLANIPLTTAMMDSSNARVEKSMLKVALIYKEKLSNNPKSKEYFNELLRRFPNTPYGDQAYYNLFRLFSVEGNQSDARFYMNKLIKEFPQSDYAKILQDPDYFKKLQKEANKVKEYYKETYNLFTENQFAKVQQNCAKAKVDFPENKAELAKFEMLNALSVGHAGDTASFVKALEIVVNNYPISEVSPIAQQMIDQLKKGETTVGEPTKGSEASEKNTVPDKESIYVYKNPETHLFLIIGDKNKVKISDLKNSISNHNSSYFASENLTISSIPINGDLMLIGVSNFTDETIAMNYLKTVQRNSPLMDLVNANGGNYFVISDGNYARLYKSKDIEAYRKFYGENYKQK